MFWNKKPYAESLVKSPDLLRWDKHRDTMTAYPVSVGVWMKYVIEPVAGGYSLNLYKHKSNAYLGLYLTPESAMLAAQEHNRKRA